MQENFISGSLKLDQIRMEKRKVGRNFTTIYLWKR